MGYEPRHAGERERRFGTTQVASGAGVTAAILGTATATAAHAGAAETALPSILQNIRFCESSNNYAAQNAVSSASGAFQFLDSTWRGIPGTSGYSKAKYAPAWLQNQAAVWLYNQYGTSPWLESKPCWSKLAGTPNVPVRNTGGTTAPAPEPAPAPRPVAAPAPKPAPAPAPKPVAPAPKPVIRVAPKPAAPATRPVIHRAPVQHLAAPAHKAVAKPAPAHAVVPVAKPAPKPVTKPITKAATASTPTTSRDTARPAAAHTVAQPQAQAVVAPTAAPVPAATPASEPAPAGAPGLSKGFSQVALAQPVLTTQDKAAATSISAAQQSQSWWTPQAAAGDTLTRTVNTAPGYPSVTHSAPQAASAAVGYVANGDKLVGHYVNTDWFAITQGPSAGQFVSSSVLLRVNDVVNGQLDEATQLVKVPSYLVAGDRTVYLNPTVTNALIRLNAAARQATGTGVQIVDGYRTVEAQQILVDKYGTPYAAPAGQSNHGLGLALGFSGAQISPKNAAWLSDYLRAFGFHTTAPLTGPGYVNVNFIG